MTQHFRLRTFVACLLTASTYAVVPSAFAGWFAYGDYRGCTGRGYEGTQQITFSGDNAPTIYPP